MIWSGWIFSGGLMLGLALGYVIGHQRATLQALDKILDAQLERARQIKAHMDDKK